MSALKNPTSPLVARAWLALVDGITAEMTGTTLPPIRDNSLPAWTGTGFLSVMTVGGSPDPDTLMAQPVVSVKCWAVNASQPGSGTNVAVQNKIPWARSEQLAEYVRHAIQPLAHAGAHLVTLPVAGYSQATVLAAQMVSEIRPLQDPSGYACHQFDLLLNWVPVVA